MQQQMEALQARFADSEAPRVKAQPQPAAVQAHAPVQPLQAQPVARAPAARRALVQPGELTYSTASQPGVIDNWVFKMGQLFAQLGVAADDWPARLHQAALAWDRPTDQWWRAHQALLQARGTPIGSWDAFVEALHSHFVPVKDAEAATEEFLRLRQRGAESMDEYLLRASQLLLRTGGKVQDETAAQMVLSHVDEHRFQWTLRAVRKLVRASEKPLSFAAMRAALVEEALSEPKPTGAGAPRGASHSGGGGAGASGQPSRRSSCASTRCARSCNSWRAPERRARATTTTRTPSCRLPQWEGRPSSELQRLRRPAAARASRGSAPSAEARVTASGSARARRTCARATAATRWDTWWPTARRAAPRRLQAGLPAERPSQKTAKPGGRGE